jgi:hypothetical protein
MTGPKSPITVEDVDHIFDDACINELVGIAKLPSSADHRRFGESIREAVRIYAHDVREPNANQLHSQILDLHRAAQRQEYERVATLIQNLPQIALGLLEDNAAQQDAGISLEALHDEAQRESVCAKIAGLCRIGGGKLKGRKRPTGRRSVSWRWQLHAPAPTTTFLKRQAELNFVMNLQLAWAEATGEKPAQSANAYNLGPFARMAQKCFKLAGTASTTNASVAGRINELNQLRKPSTPVR